MSVRPSVTRVYCIKTAERIIEIISLADKPIIVVFGHQRLLRKSDGFTANGGADRVESLLGTCDFATYTRNELDLTGVHPPKD